MKKEIEAHNPLTDPRPGDVVQSLFYHGENQVGRRIVISASPMNIRYATGTGRKIIERDVLPVTWRRWCREHRARVVTEDRRDY